MNGNGSNFVTIRMKPDSQGRFGFNVKVCCWLQYYLVISFLQYEWNFLQYECNNDVFSTKPRDWLGRAFPKWRI